MLRTPLVVNAAPTARTAPTASDATISARRDKAFLLWPSDAMREPLHRTARGTTLGGVCGKGNMKGQYSLSPHCCFRTCSPGASLCCGKTENDKVAACHYHLGAGKPGARGEAGAG